MRLSGLGNRRFWVIVVIMAAIGAVYYFYFFIVVKSQSEDLERRGFRILEQVERNLKEKLENYNGSVQNYRNQAREIDTLSQIISRKIIAGYEQNSYAEDLVRKAFESTHFYIRDKEGLIDFASSQIKKPPQKDLELLLKEFLKSRIHQELIHKAFVPKMPNGGISPHFIKIQQGGADTFYVDVEDLMANLQFDSFFSHLLLQDTSAVIYDPNAYDLNADSLLALHRSHLGSYVTNLKISSTSYKAFVNPVNLHDREYYLIGLAQSDQFARQARQMNPLIIIVGALAILVVLIALPLFKLAVMSNIERLRQSDIFLAANSIIVISSVFTLLWLNLYTSYGPERGEINASLKTLTRSISASLENEINQICAQLDQYNSAELKHFNIIAPENKLYPVFNELFTINKYGFINTYSATRYPYIVSNPATARLNVNLSSRDYFTKALNQTGLWQCGEKAFYMEPVYSYTTGQIEAAISVPCDGYVKALTAPVFSLIDVTLPTGYSYCIIDETGKTIFHSARNRTLRENFIRECNQPHELIKAINHRVGRIADLNYSARPQRVYIEPLQISELKSPLFIVALYDKSIRQAKNTGILIISFIFLSGLILALMTLSALIKLNNVKQSRLSFNRFSFYWLLPEERNRKHYRWLIIINLLNALLLMIFYRLAADMLNVVFILGISVIFISLVTYISLINLKFDEFFHYFRRKRFFIETLTIGLLTLSVLNMVLFGGSLFNILYPVFAISTVAIIFLLKKREQMATQNQEHLSRYSLFLVSWIFTIAIVPSTILYKIAWEEVSRQELKVIHREAAAELQQRSRLLSNEQLDSIQLVIKTQPDKGTYLQCVYETEILPACEDCLPPPPVRNAAFFDEISGRIHAVMPYNRLTWNNFAKDASQYYNLVSDGRYYTVFRDYRGENPIILRAALPQFRLPPLSDLNILYWLVAAGLVAGLYYLTRFFVKRIIYRYDVRELAPIDAKSFKKLADKKNIFLFGAPYSGKTKLINEYLSHFKTEETGEFNIFNPGPEEIINRVKNLNVVALKDFEYNLHDIAFNDKKLVLLESLLQTRLRVIVSSTVALKQIIDVYRSRLEATADPEERLALQHSVDRWENLLYGFYSISYPLHTTVNNKYAPKERLALGDELEHGDYLAGLKNYICNLFMVRQMQLSEITEKYKEAIIIKIQEIAESYYYALWNSCSTLEKYVLFDIADDGFVNSNNEATIKQLLKKGLIRWDGSLQIMNQSFRNFILTSTPSGEALKMEREARKKGSWNKFKIVLSLILAGIAILYVLAEPDFLNKISSIVTAIAALLPAVYTLSRSLIDSGDSGGMGE